MSRAIFLDRDGVINAMVTGVTVAGVPTIDSPQRPGEFRLLPQAAAGIRRLRDLSLPLVVVSNQPGIAKGKSTIQLLTETTEWLHNSLASWGTGVDAVYYCLHHPEAVQPEYRVRCDCRKPRAGLLRQAAQDLGLILEGSYLVGDQPTDIEAGRAVGCRTILVGEPGGPGVPPPEVMSRVGADYLGRDLGEAAAWICQMEAARGHSGVKGESRWKSLPIPPISLKFGRGFNTVSSTV